MLNQIIDLQLNRVKERLTAKKIDFKYTSAVKEIILEKCTNGETGARMIDAVITQNLLPEISTVCLNALVDGKNIEQISLSAKKNEFIFKSK